MEGLPEFFIGLMGNPMGCRFQFKKLPAQKSAAEMLKADS